MGRLAWAAAFAILAAGCGEAMMGGDAGPDVEDAGPGAMDGGPIDDGGAPLDASPIEDAGEDGGALPDDSGMDGDSGPADAGAAACLSDDLVIAAISPGTVGGTIAIYNASASAVDVDATDYLLHEDPDSVLLRDLESGVVIPAGGLHRFAYPLAFSDGHASGEMALYRDTAIDSPSSLIDFVCWGFGHSATFSVQPVAELDGDWSGTCTSSLSGDELRRIRDTDGRSRASYDPTGLTALFACP